MIASLMLSAFHLCIPIEPFHPSPSIRSLLFSFPAASSWAFSSVASVSYGAAIGGNTTSLLSVQQLIDCTAGDNTCNMGWPYAALDYMVTASAQPTGLDTDSYYPYTAMQGTCAPSGVSPPSVLCFASLLPV